MDWSGPLTDRQLRVWIWFQKIFREGDKPDLSLDGVPLEIRKRWERRVGMAAYCFASGQERSIRARKIAQATGRDEGQVYDELTKNEQPASQAY